MKEDNTIKLSDRSIRIVNRIIEIMENNSGKFTKEVIIEDAISFLFNYICNCIKIIDFHNNTIIVKRLTEETTIKINMKQLPVTRELLKNSYNPLVTYKNLDKKNQKLIIQEIQLLLADK